MPPTYVEPQQPCTESSATLSVPNENVSKDIGVDQKDQYTLESFSAFKLSGDTNCGWNQPYKVEVMSGDSSSVTYPRPGVSISACTGYDNCLKMQIKRSIKTTLKIQITGTTLGGYIKKVQMTLNIKCLPGSTRIVANTPNQVVPDSILRMDAVNPNYLQ